MVAVLVAVLPRRCRPLAGRWLLGWDVHPSAQLGRSIIAARVVVIGPGAVIGSLNMIRGIEELRLDAEASLGVMNWISGPSLGVGLFGSSPRRYPALLMGRGAAITTRHFIDCSDTVRLAEFATVAGIRSTIFTHSADLVRNRQTTSPVEIGARSAVMSNCVVLAGCRVPERSIVSAGSVVNTMLEEELTFYSGVPATSIRKLPDNLGYFDRTEPYID